MRAGAEEAYAGVCQNTVSEEDMFSKPSTCVSNNQCCETKGDKRAGDANNPNWETRKARDIGCVTGMTVTIDEGTEEIVL